MADIDALLNFSASIDNGMTSLPNDPNAWEKKLEINEASILAPTPQPTGDIYLFLLECPETKKIVGTTAIYTGVGLQRPFYSYKLSTHVCQSDILKKTVKTQVMHLVNDFTGATELASLYLLPEFRKPNAGRFLSKSRFLMLHEFPDRFHQLIFAELRGWVDDKGNSPFWKGLGEKFFNVPFLRADYVSAVTGSQFISDLMPKYPVYLDLLPESAQKVVGQCNDNSIPAKRLLEQEGFQWKGYVDIFDAGPSMQCDLQHIDILKKSQKRTIKGYLKTPVDQQHYIVSNGRLADYKIALCQLLITDEGVHIPEHIAQSLQIQTGDAISFMPMRTK